MATGWETYPVEFQGGLVTNLGPLQLGINKPGAARRLVNFEPSVEGGYRRILGYSKFTEELVASYGKPLVQGSGQTGLTLQIANLFQSPVVGSSFRVTGVTGTYVVSTVSYSETNKTATLTFTPSLNSSPADKAAVIFTDAGNPFNLIAFFRDRAVVQRGGVIWEATGGGSWSLVSVPSYGSVAVSGAGQTGTTLTVSGLVGVPRVGETFSVGGVELVYTVVSVTPTTITFTPSLNSSPANAAVITFLSANRSATEKVRFVRYTFSTSPTLMLVDSTNAPAKYDGTTFQTLTGAPSDVIGAEHVEEYKSHIFFAKGTTVAFTAPFTDDNFAVGDGAGVINLAHSVTGLKVFRDQLIVFCNSKIYRIVGNSFADFQLLPISLDIGCIEPDSIQEVGGDVAFLGPDGVRLLGATERIGDFSFGIVSRNIQSEVLTFLQNNPSISSTVIRGKNQYRLFGFNEATPPSLAAGILGTQFADQTSEQGAFSWAQISGINVYVVDSQYTQEAESIIFANNNGYVYEMESSNSFDGAAIQATFYTPYLPINDPRLRKTLFKVTSYFNPEGSVVGTLGIKYDFNQPGLIQPDNMSIQNSSGSGLPIWGEVVWGSFTYSDLIQTVFNSQTVGSGNTISLEYTFDSLTPPFSLDAAMLEYKTDDRK